MRTETRYLEIKKKEIIRMRVKVLIFDGIRVIVRIPGIAVSIVKIQTTKRENR